MLIHPSIIPYYNWYWYYSELTDMTISESIYYGASITASSIAFDMFLWYGYGMRPIQNILVDPFLARAIMSPGPAAFLAATAYTTVAYSKILKDPTHPHTAGRLQEAKAGYPQLGGVGFY